jgi:hypothetical protein
MYSTIGQEIALIAHENKEMDDFNLSNCNAITMAPKTLFA